MYGTCDPQDSKKSDNFPIGPNIWRFAKKESFDTDNIFRIINMLDQIGNDIFFDKYCQSREHHLNKLEHTYINKYYDSFIGEEFFRFILTKGLFGSVEDEINNRGGRDHPHSITNVDNINQWVGLYACEMKHAQLTNNHNFVIYLMNEFVIIMNTYDDGDQLIIKYFDRAVWNKVFIEFYEGDMTAVSYLFGIPFVGCYRLWSIERKTEINYMRLDTLMNQQSVDKIHNYCNKLVSSKCEILY
jgi:hypothetical protein